jgi:hypothetical protein
MPSSPAARPAVFTMPPQVVGEFFAPPASKSSAARLARPKINASCFNTVCYN